MFELCLIIAYWLSLVLFIFVFTGVAIRLTMLVLSIAWIVYEKRMLRSVITEFPKISMLIPAYNEENTIIESVTHAINQD